MTAAAPLGGIGPMSLAFEEFYRANPHVYRIMVRLARDWVNTTGRSKLGIAMLYERARWEISLSTTGDEYKLNNDWRAYYARLIMFREPDLDDLFDLRVSEADWWIQAVISRGGII